MTSAKISGTLARVSNLIARMFRTRYAMRGTSYLLRRVGWSSQVPSHRPTSPTWSGSPAGRYPDWPGCTHAQTKQPSILTAPDQAS
ncbi:winged helix-turn-helix domain-containing protein [Micromonospora zhanjiangensis]|uniref:Winged helix-turn-helix domain-containing protein n=1 Tax=Micromonospora zhanjiangensis TaxID=1522057 RepID=A0ABV8KX60_9ACTN